MATPSISIPLRSPRQSSERESRNDISPLLGNTFFLIVAAAGLHFGTLLCKLDLSDSAMPLHIQYRLER